VIILPIIYLPCGCAVDGEQVHAIQDGALLLIECPWCAACFVYPELLEWVEVGNNGRPVVERGPYPLASTGAKLIEVLRPCGCGRYVVREYGARKEFHLETTAERVRG
jgi:hypothetical protein